MPLIYLVGPITGCSFEGCTDWRKWFAQQMRDRDMLNEIRCLDPMRGRLYLQHETSIDDKYDDHIMSTGKAIFHRDRFDCMRADLIVANFIGATKVSTGSVMECAWANAMGKPIIAAMEARNPHDHAMLREACGWIVPSLEQAADVALAILAHEIL